MKSQITTPFSEFLSMQTTTKGRQHPNNKIKKGKRKKKNGGCNTSTNDTNNTDPSKKWDKSKLCNLCEDPHLMINYPKLAEAKRLLI